MKHKKYISGLWVAMMLNLIFAGQSVGQVVPDSLAPAGPYPFLKMGYNVLQNDSAALSVFYGKLKQLQTGTRDRVVVVHIGDSHLQADFFSGAMRTALQSVFGNAGRGLIFPYKVAGTNSPTDIRSATNVTWDAKRNVFPAKPLPIGISGITIRTADSNFVLQCGITPNDSLDYSFDRIKLFCERGENCYDLKVCRADGEVMTPEYTTSTSTQYHTVQRGQTLSHIAGRYGCSVSQLQQWNSIRGTTIYPGQKLAVNAVVRTARPVPPTAFHDYAVIPGNGNTATPAEVNLGEKVNTFWLRPTRTNSAQNQSTLFGVVLDDSKAKGLLYHMIGVNGAKFEHYRVSTYFAEQLTALKPDLIIISLGTNETMDANYSDTVFRAQVEECLASLRSAIPGTAVLITSPNDNFSRRRYVNPDCANAANTLGAVAKENGFAFWDFYHLMGGQSSMTLWKNAGLANYDRIHLTKAGYELQGSLLFQALMGGYHKYLTR